MPHEPSLSIYVHIPFCRTRCGYCDFNTYAGLDNLIDAYVRNLISEIKITADTIGLVPEIHTIYFGGGTPNLLSPGQLGAIFKKIVESFASTANLEINTEANPTCLTYDFLSQLKDWGVNRLSLGMQSASEQDLKILGRWHTFNDVQESVDNAKKAGFENISLDLIFGIPHQTLPSFARSLKSACILETSHLSIYALTIEDSTPIAGQIASKSLPEPDEDLAADMYLDAMEILEREGFVQYEISNWSREELSQCRHNLQYWHNRDYLGFGAGAHSLFRKTRWENHKKISDYIEAVSRPDNDLAIISPAGFNKISLTKNDEMAETMLMGMRLTNEGVNSVEFKERFGVALADIYAKEITRLVEMALVEWVVIDAQHHLRLTRKGRLLGNQVFMQFIPD